MSKRLAAVLVAATLALATAPFAEAGNGNGNGRGHGKGKGDRGIPHGQIERMQHGAAKSIPPGQLKRFARGTRLPDDRDYTVIRDLSDWRLGPLARDERYVRVDDEVLRVQRDTNTVIEAIGIVGDLLR